MVGSANCSTAEVAAWVKSKYATEMWKFDDGTTHRLRVATKIHGLTTPFLGTVVSTTYDTHVAHPQPSSYRLSASPHCKDQVGSRALEKSPVYYTHTSC